MGYKTRCVLDICMFPEVIYVIERKGIERKVRLRNVQKVGLPPLVTSGKKTNRGGSVSHVANLKADDVSIG